jgi:hypothetical protein
MEDYLEPGYRDEYRRDQGHAGTAEHKGRLEWRLMAEEIRDSMVGSARVTRLCTEGREGLVQNKVGTQFGQVFRTDDGFCLVKRLRMADRYQHDDLVRPIYPSTVAKRISGQETQSPLDKVQRLTKKTGEQFLSVHMEDLVTASPLQPRWNPATSMSDLLLVIRPFRTPRPTTLLCPAANSTSPRGLKQLRSMMPRRRDRDRLQRPSPPLTLEAAAAAARHHLSEIVESGSFASMGRQTATSRQLIRTFSSQDWPPRMDLHPSISGSRYVR